MIDKIRNTIQECSLLNNVRKILVAVSGGADSIATLTALHELSSEYGFSVSALHVNHCIRGLDADSDATFTANYCSKLGIKCEIVCIDVPLCARESGESLEMAARSARYNALAENARTISADAVATGHNADDQLETFLMRLGRGSGLRGLGGIRPSTAHPSGITVIRPLIDCRREEIREWLISKGIAWVEDKTNLDTEIIRNNVRKNLIPEFEKSLGPTSADALLRTMRILRDEEDWLDTVTKESLKSACDIDGSLICSKLPGPRPMRRRVILSWLHDNLLPLEFQSLRLVDQIANAADEPANGSHRIQAGSEIEVIREYGKLRYATRRFEKIDIDLKSGIEIPLSTASDCSHETVLQHGTLVLKFKRVKGVVKSLRTLPRQLPQKCSLSLANIFNVCPLFLRTIRPGDRITPFGSSGRMKISDILINEKVPKVTRSQIIVLAPATGDVVWIPGFTIDDAFAVNGADEESLLVSIAESVNGDLK